MGKTNYTRIVFILILLLSSHLQSKAQENTRRPVYKHFKIMVKVDGDTIKLRCLDGCAWQELSFVQPYTLKGQAINQYGMTTIGSLNQLKMDDKFADFVLTLKRDGNELIIKGNEGVDWESLIIPCGQGCTEYISEKGKNKITKPMQGY